MDDPNGLESSDYWLYRAGSTILGKPKQLISYA